MNLNSQHFDRVRASSRPQKAKPSLSGPACDHIGCVNAGEFRAPMGRDREGQYFCFCLDHVREYNARYDYFTGMSDDAVARYQKDALVGHRPTWNMGVNRAATAAAAAAEAADWAHPDHLGIFRARAGARAAQAPARPHYSHATMGALSALGLDEHADDETVKRRYKQLVKQLHPDANGGDRSSEEKLREIIRAYKFLKTVRLGRRAAEPAR